MGFFLRNGAVAVRRGGAVSLGQQLPGDQARVKMVSLLLSQQVPAVESHYSLFFSSGTRKTRGTAPCSEPA